jgi:acetyl-CoA acyltransferase 2
VFVVAAGRSAIGSFGGCFANMSAIDLGAAVTAGLFARSGVDASAIDGIYYGNVAQTSLDAPYLSRHVGLKAGVDLSTPASTVNRLCASGFESIIAGTKDILLGDGDVMLAGGAESMSNAPFVSYDMRFQKNRGLGSPVQMQDALWAALTDAYIKTPMGVTSENLAKQYKITRQDTDELALLSQQRWKEASDAGVYDAETIGVSVKTGKRGTEDKLCDTDEHPRPQTTLESLGKLKPVFAKDGVTTAGNSSGIGDGAASLILASEEGLAKLGSDVKPLAEVVSWYTTGVDPNVMGIGPAPAIRGALERASLTLRDMELIEVNEAFAAQYIAVERELGLDRSKTNVNGSSIALAHPLGMSGSRIMTHLVHEMIRRSATRSSDYSVGSACVGGGQGTAIILKSLM